MGGKANPEATKKKPGRKKASEPLPKPEEMTESQKRTEQERLERLSRPFWIPTDKSGNDYRWQFLSDEAAWLILKLDAQFRYGLISVGETVHFTGLSLFQVRDMLAHFARWGAISRAGNLYQLKPNFVRLAKEKRDKAIKAAEEE